MRPEPEHPDEQTGQNHSVLGGESVIAQALWDALHNARTAGEPSTQAGLEDALFQFYLPLARAAAAGNPAWNTDPAAAISAVELGLSHAVLAWQQQDSTGFERFARLVIASQLRLLGKRPQHRARVQPDP